jgi:hypothetical protein
MLRVAVVACTIGCSAGVGGTTIATPTAPRELFDSALLAHVPADTPYAFATFSPVSSRMLRRYVDMATPRIVDPTLLTKWQDLLLLLYPLDAKHFAELGLAPNGRAVIYGLGPWPVARMEIANGDRLFAFVQRIAKAWGVVLPAPREHAGRRYWIFDETKNALLVAIGRDEVIAAIAPRIVLDTRLRVVLGDQPPPRAIAPAAFRELAARDGFSGRGVGFVDVARASELARDAAPMEPACGDALRELASHAPRVAFGYDDLGGGGLSWGVVVELAPELRAAARALTAPLPGADKLVATAPLFGAAISVDIDRARAALRAVAATALALGTSCGSAALASAGRELDQAAHVPLPLGGPISIVFAVTDLVRSERRGPPEKIDGYVAVYADDVAPVVQLATSQLPMLAIPPDGTVIELPPTLAPLAGHVAATRTAFAAAVGEGSERAVTGAIAATPPATRPPIATLVYDYARAATLFEPGDAKLAELFGTTTLDLFADERGVVLWMTTSLK